MIAPNCPDHERLVLDLALGRLDDEAALEAENVSESCPVCRAWWQAQFEGEMAEVVDDAVAAAITNLELPVRRRSRGWLAAAAVAVMALGVGSLWVSQANRTVDEATAHRSASIQVFDFENPAAFGEVVKVAAPDGDSMSNVQVITEDGLATASAPVEVENSGDAFFSGGFESGELGAWVPST